jgi:ATP-dependent DNA helicase RecG
VQNLLLVGGQRASVILRALAARQVIQRAAGTPTRGPSVRYTPGPAFPVEKRGR